MPFVYVDHANNVLLTRNNPNLLVFFPASSEETAKFDFRPVWRQQRRREVEERHRPRQTSASFPFQSDWTCWDW